MTRSSSSLIAALFVLAACEVDPQPEPDASDPADSATSVDGADGNDGSTMEPLDAGGELDADGELDASDAQTLDAEVSDAAVDSQMPTDASADATTDGAVSEPEGPLAYRCGFRGDPHFPDAVLATGTIAEASDLTVFEPGRAGPARRSAWMVGDRVVTQTPRNSPEQLPGMGGYILWSATTGLQIAHGGEPVIAAAGDAFLTYRPQMGETFFLRSLATGAEITSFAAPGIHPLPNHQGGLSLDASYAWVRSNGALKIFNRDGSASVDVTGNYGSSVAYGAPDALWIGAGPQAPEVVRLPRNGSAATTTSGVVGTFSAWFDDGLHFVTSQVGLTRVYTREGTRVLGPLSCGEPYFVQGNQFGCWVGNNLSLYNLDGSTAAVATVDFGTSNATRTVDGFVAYAGQRVFVEPNALRVAAADTSTRNELIETTINAQTVPRFRYGGVVRDLGCGALSNMDGASNGLVSLTTRRGTFLYDSNTSQFVRFFDYVDADVPYPELNLSGTRAQVGKKVYELSPSFVELGEYQTMNETGTRAGVWDADSFAVPSAWQVVTIPGSTVVASGTYSNLMGRVAVAPAGQSIAVIGRGPVGTWYPAAELYSGSTLTGSIPRVETAVWLSAQRLLVNTRDVYDTEGSLQPAPRCAPRPDYGAAWGLQVLSESTYYVGGAVCDISSGTGTPPAVTLRYGIAPGRLAGQLGVYDTGNVVVLGPWQL